MYLYIHVYSIHVYMYAMYYIYTHCIHMFITILKRIEKQNTTKVAKVVQLTDCSIFLRLLYTIGEFLKLGLPN